MVEGKRGGGGALKFNTTLIPPKLRFSVAWGRVVITTLNILFSVVVSQ